MIKIICIVGPSGCGKTTLANAIQREMKIKTLVSCTTRPMRGGESDGVEHYFVDKEDVPSREKMLAYTNFGGYEYWVDLCELPSQGVCTYVIDEAGLIDLKKNYGDRFDIRSIKINRDKKKLENQVGCERVKRDSERVNIPDNEYDKVINNNESLTEFLEIGYKTIKSLL